MAGAALSEEHERELRAIVGEEHLSTDPKVCRRLAADLSLLPFEPAAAVVSPGSLAELAAAVAAAHRAGLSIATRGGGMSYTHAHPPTRPGTLLLDTGRLHRVVSVEADDLYAVVEAGCTWEALTLALREHGLRTPFWGPLSGAHATIGGTLSQNAAFYGSAGYGTAAESVLGLTVVLADGTVVRTGSGGCAGAGPFARYFGPDLTGLFLADSGALGIKAEASLRLVPAPAVALAASFAFERRADAVEAMREMARLGVASDLFAFDRYYHGLLDRLGFGFLAEQAFSLHAVVEGHDLGHAASALALLVEIGRRHGRELDPSVPLAIRADPFGATRTLFKGEERGVHLPVHAFVPFSRAPRAVAALEELLAEHGATLAAQEIGIWTLMLVAGKDFLLEGSLFFGGDYRDPSVAAEARATVLALRRELATRWDAVGSIHVQVGRYYDYAGRLENGTRSLLEQVKRLLDPEGALAAGALGLP